MTVGALLNEVKNKFTAQVVSPARKQSQAANWSAVVLVFD